MPGMTEAEANSLPLAGFVLPRPAVGAGRLAAVSGHRAAGVELPEAGRVRPLGLPAPDGPALAVHERAAAVEAVSEALPAGHRVLDEEVRRAEAGEARADLGQVALVGGVAARVPGGAGLASEWKEREKNIEGDSKSDAVSHPQPHPAVFVAAVPGRALRVPLQPARHGVAARVDLNTVILYNRGEEERFVTISPAC